jgi:hypothetical protein
VGTLARVALVAGSLAALGTGCSLEKVGKGATCTRSTQCATGLACVYPKGDGQAKAGKCSGDLSSLNDPSQVPKLTPDAGMAADGGDAAADGSSGDAATDGAQAAVDGGDAGR